MDISENDPVESPESHEPAMPLVVTFLDTRIRWEYVPILAVFMGVTSTIQIVWGGHSIGRELCYWVFLIGGLSAFYLFGGTISSLETYRLSIYSSKIKRVIVGKPDIDVPLDAITGIQESPQRGLFIKAAAPAKSINVPRNASKCAEVRQVLANQFEIRPVSGRLLIYSLPQWVSMLT